MNLGCRASSFFAGVVLFCAAVITCAPRASALGLGDIPRLKDAYDAYKDVRNFYDHIEWMRKVISNTAAGEPLPPIPGTDWAAEKVEQRLQELQAFQNKLTIPQKFPVPSVGYLVAHSNVASNLRGAVALHQWDLSRLRTAMQLLNGIQMQVDELKRASDDSSRLLRQILDQNLAPGLVTETIALAIISRDAVISPTCGQISTQNHTKFQELNETYNNREKEYATYDRQAETVAQGFDAAAARGESESEYRHELNRARTRANSDDGFPGYRPTPWDTNPQSGVGDDRGHGTVSSCGSGCISYGGAYDVAGTAVQSPAEYQFIPTRLWVAKPPKRLPFVVPPHASIIVFEQFPTTTEAFVHVWAEYQDDCKDPNGCFDDILMASGAAGGNPGSVTWTNESPYNAIIKATANRGSEESFRPEDTIEPSGSAFLEEIAFFSFGYKPAPNEAADISPTPDEAVIVVARTDPNPGADARPLPGEPLSQTITTLKEGIQLFSFAALSDSVHLSAMELFNGEERPPFPGSDITASPLYSEEREWASAADVSQLRLSADLLPTRSPLTWRSVNINGFTIAGAGFAPGSTAEQDKPLKIIALAEQCYECEEPGLDHGLQPMATGAFSRKPRSKRLKVHNAVHWWTRPNPLVHFSNR